MNFATSRRTVSGGGRRVQVGENGFHSRFSAGGRLPGPAGRVADEPARLDLGRGAEIEEMERPAQHPGGVGAMPLRLEFRVQPVAAFGGLDPGKVGPGGAGPRTSRPRAGSDSRRSRAPAARRVCGAPSRCGSASSNFGRRRLRPAAPPPGLAPRPAASRHQPGSPAVPLRPAPCRHLRAPFGPTMSRRESRQPPTGDAPLPCPPRGLGAWPPGPADAGDARAPGLLPPAGAALR